MGHTYRTEPDPPEEQTESGARDADETMKAFYDGIWVAVASMFGVLFLVLVMIQTTRVFPASNAYGAASPTSWLTLAVATALLLGVISWGLTKRPTATAEPNSRGSAE
ncbi:hypothetical protein [Halostagnicola kamekurae]|uniref:Uncharacterized protein n=1 Tax=Halostagnicola kamekurae TaxID=619731 RepID=A0A1I6UG83_9EURY|nr:hypothetical protein [Halostagnicola kamekurae]SFT00486.1 hypothetical protein SAMN04488556_3845 [Halostagnicola kamekurae]